MASATQKRFEFAFRFSQKHKLKVLIKKPKIAFKKKNKLFVDSNAIYIKKIKEFQITCIFPIVILTNNRNRFHLFLSICCIGHLPRIVPKYQRRETLAASNSNSLNRHCSMGRYCARHIAVCIEKKVYWYLSGLLLTSQTTTFVVFLTKHNTFTNNKPPIFRCPNTF